MMPDYPETRNEGVLHVIHSKNPIRSEDIPEKELHQAFTDEMSRVRYYVQGTF